MMQGYPLSATLPEETGLGERFWYWRGTSGQSYIHSIYARDLCPAVPGAVFVIVRNLGGTRRPVMTGRFGADGILPLALPEAGQEEIHVHLLSRDAAAEAVLRDLEQAMDSGVRPQAPEARPLRKPVQLELLAA